jgi:hypothetical protein
MKINTIIINVPDKKKNMKVITISILKYVKYVEINI